LIASLDPATGGPVESVRISLNYGSEQDAQEVVTLDDPSAGFLREIPFPVHALGPHIHTYGYCGRLIPWLKANRSRFDGVVIHGLWQYCGFSVLRTIRGRVPYVVYPHGMLDPYFKHAFPIKHLKKWLYWILLEYWVLRGALCVLFTSETEEIQAKRSFWLHRWQA
jgi:glycosyltransferase involved in cell wall biosynthesis